MKTPTFAEAIRKLKTRPIDLNPSDIEAIKARDPWLAKAAVAACLRARRTKDLQIRHGRTVRLAPDASKRQPTRTVRLDDPSHRSPAKLRIPDIVRESAIGAQAGPRAAAPAAPPVKARTRANIDAMADVVVDIIKRATDPLKKEIAALETRCADLEARDAR